jgi:hypothetical protein
MKVRVKVRIIGFTPRLEDASGRIRVQNFLIARLGEGPGRP